jgi:hypothetical protein
VLSDREKKNLSALGWKEGDPLPSSLSNVVAEEMNKIDPGRVVGLVVVPLQVSAGLDAVIAPGTATQLTATANGGQPPYAFAWKPVDSMSDSASGAGVWSKSSM